ncbi:nucleotidyltransferase domain-containing protein [Candidatus Bipolaricaulota bacterium]|nr:nucleotidyltransferase domain-containing protein [Candidatus Bipolaricaulota bacterium]
MWPKGFERLSRAEVILWRKGRSDEERVEGADMGTTEFYRGPSGGILPGLQVDLKEALERLKDLFQRRGVALAYLFGSYAHDEARAASDVDIAILLYCSGKELYSAYRELMLGVREALGTERFDLLLLNDASPTLQFEIISQGRLVYSRDEQVLNSFEMGTIRRFQDTAYLRAVQNDYLKERAREWYSRKKVF